MKELFPQLTAENIESANVIFTGIPFDKNVSIGSGAAKAPNHMRSLLKMYPPMTQFGKKITKIRVFDNGNITTDDFTLMQKEAFKAINTKRFPIFIGGDHSVAIATERAFYDYAKNLNKEPVIIHIDAHPDICDIYEENKYSHACPNKRSLDYGYSDENLTMIGMRCFEPQEVEFLNSHKDITYLTAEDVREMGVKRIIDLLKEKYDNPKNMIYLSYDIDANDPAYAPGTGTPEPWGLESLTTLNLILGIIKELNVRAMDIVEVSPDLDHNDLTMSLAIKTIYEIFYVLEEKIKD